MCGGQLCPTRARIMLDPRQESAHHAMEVARTEPAAMMMMAVVVLVAILKGAQRGPCKPRGTYSTSAAEKSH